MSVHRVSATEYSQTLENGKRWIISLGKGQAPAGPIGIRGKLTSIYVDDNIRIDAGEQYDYLDDKGNVLNLNGNDWCVTLVCECLYQY